MKKPREIRIITKSVLESKGPHPEKDYHPFVSN